MQALGDDLLVRRAARRVAVQVAGLVAVAMLLLVAAVTLAVVRSQQSSGDALLRMTAATADDVGDPPPGAWVLLARGAQITASPGLPQDLPVLLTPLRAGATTTPRLDSLREGEESFRVVTRVRDDVVVQVVLDLAPQEAERNRLLRVMAVAALLSLLLSAGVGIILSRRAVRPLADALLLQRSFVADASHELRTPLTLLSTRVQVLDHGLHAAGVDPVLLEDSRGVRHDVARLGEVVEDLLVAADPRRDHDHHAVDLGPLAEGVAASAAAHAAAAHVAVEVVRGGGAVVRGSEPALRRAVLALVDNAIDHSPEAGTVTVGVRSVGRHVVLSVSDTGPGIPPEAREGLLRRFHSGGQRSGRSHYGLGLALTHDVANRHGGQLVLARTGPDEGTTFDLVLPAFKE